MVKVFKSDAGKEQVLRSYNELLGDWGTEIRELDIETPYGTTHCITSGEAGLPPLLLFHGVGDNSAVMWLLNIRELSRHFLLHCGGYAGRAWEEPAGCQVQ